MHLSNPVKFKRLGSLDSNHRFFASKSQQIYKLAVPYTSYCVSLHPIDPILIDTKNEEDGISLLSQKHHHYTYPFDASLLYEGP